MFLIPLLKVKNIIDWREGFFFWIHWAINGILPTKFDALHPNIQNLSTLAESNTSGGWKLSHFEKLNETTIY